MHLGDVALRAPTRPAILMAGSERTLTYGSLDSRANQLSHLFRERGLRAGHTVAVLLQNEPELLEVVWAAQRSGLYYTVVNWHLSASEAAYILEDCGADLVVSSLTLAPLLAEPAFSDALRHVRTRLMVGGATPDWEAYEEAVSTLSPQPLADPSEGDFILYSSGTTGRPKGVKRPLQHAPLGRDPLRLSGFLRQLGIGDESVYLSPAPLYHAAPLSWAITAQRLGATVVVMERFDPLQCLALIERHGVSHGQFVPTMFTRLLKLPEEQRRQHDLSSLRVAVHAAAPCPVHVKRQMIDWWGPILFEYYSSTEGIGATWVDSSEWLEHPGTVGKVGLGKVHILDEDHVEVPVGQQGTVWFEGGRTFEYHNDSAKTDSALDQRGWATVGDVGYVDDDGYLYLTDRKDFLIISGGVNIYPREVEDVLTSHPQVLDAAVIGVPDEDLGESVQAVVQLVDPDRASQSLATELITHCRSRIAHFKCPRSVEFVDSLPRSETGKLVKRLLTTDLSSRSAQS